MKDDERSFGPGFVLLRAGDATITLQDASAPEAQFGASAGVEIGFVVEDVAAAHSRFVAAGAQVEAPQTIGWGGGFNAVDLDGNLLTIYKMCADDR